MKKLDMMRAIKERGFMAKDVADKLGITTVAMSLRTNAKNPRLDTMIQIAEIIGCDITDLFYPDPTEEVEKKEVPAGTENGGKTLDTTIRGDLPEGIIERDVNFVQQLPGSEPAYPVHSDGLVSENQQQMIQTSTFCPHCGKKVRVGVVLLSGEC